MSAPGAPTGGDGGDAGQQQGDAQAPGLDPSAINSTLESLTSGQEEMRQVLQALHQQATATPEQQAQEPDPIDLSFLDAESGEFDPDQVGQQFQSAVQAEAQRVIAEQINPLRQEMQEQRRQQEFSALVQEFPEIGESEETANAVSALTAQVGQQLAQELGVDPQALASSPRLMRLVFMAGRAADAAQQEQGDVPAPATLESGAGAAPGSGGADLGDAIIGAGSGRLGRGALPFG